MPVVASSSIAFVGLPVGVIRLFADATVKEDVISRARGASAAAAIPVRDRSRPAAQANVIP